MSSSPLRCVVDASVAIKLFVLEDGSKTAERLVAQLAASWHDCWRERHIRSRPCARFRFPGSIKPSLSVVSGEWRVASGEWRVASGEW